MTGNHADRFARLLEKVRVGDQAAAAELVSEYEPLIRREVRMRLLDPRLRRVLDSGDICQSVLASFFVRAIAGQYDLESGHELLKLLLSMARNKSAEAARRQYQQRRDVRRNEGLADIEHPDRQMDSPSQLVARAEILQKVNAVLTSEEQQIVCMRRDGHSWQEVADAMGGTADGRRVQIARVVDRVCNSLGLGEPYV